jgi:hypothetical protein
MAGLDDIWNRFVDWMFNDKAIVILGPRGSGKTTLDHLLRQGFVDGERNPTIANTPRGAGHNKDLRLHIKKGTDVAGGDGDVPDWEPLFRAADLVFYTFDVIAYQNDPAYRTRLSDDGKTIRDWREKNHNKRIFVIGTHADKDPTYVLREPLSYQRRVEDAYDELLAFTGRVAPKRLVIGSLAETASAKQLLSRAVKKDDL